MKTAKEFLKERGILDARQYSINSDQNAITLISDLLTDFANQSKWISVEDRLPEVNTESFGRNYSVPVLGLTEDGDIVQTSVEYSTSEWLGKNFYITITHWQPLPTAP